MTREDRSPIFPRRGDGFSAADREASPGQTRGLLAIRTIRGKIIFSQWVVYLLGSLAALAALYSISHMQQKINLIESFYELNQRILETRRYEKNFLLYDNDEDLKSARSYLEEVRSLVKSLQGGDSLPREFESGSAADIEKKLADYGELLRRLSLSSTSDAEQVRLKEDLRDRGHTLTQLVLQIDNMARREAEQKAWRYRRIVLFILGSTLIFGAVLSVMLVRWIIEPLRYIRRAVARIMRGELTEIPLDPVSRSCVECEELIVSLNTLLHALETKQGELVQAAKLAGIGKVTAGIAHEINNPLNNISLTAEVLEEDMEEMDTAERLELVGDILAQAGRAREVVRHLLEFSRSRKPRAWQRTDMVHLIRHTLSMLRNNLRINQILVKTDLPSSPLYVMGNQNQLQQVLVNLVLNASQAMGIGGQLRIVAGVEGDRAVIEVHDNGLGIPADALGQVFEPFFTSKSDGTGLGLSVSHSIIREHKGEISVTSEVGRGTTFRIALPFEEGGEGAS